MSGGSPFDGRRPFCLERSGARLIAADYPALLGSAVGSTLITGIPLALWFALSSERRSTLAASRPRLWHSAGLAMFLSFTVLGLSVWLDQSAFRRVPRLDRTVESGAAQEDDTMREKRVLGRYRLPAPDIAGKTIDGVPWSLRDQRGRVVLIDFWASWCVPCKASMPDLQKLAERFASDERLQIVTVALDEDADAARQAFRVQGIPHTELITADGMCRTVDVRTGKLADEIALLIEHARSENEPGP